MKRLALFFVMLFLTLSVWAQKLTLSGIVTSGTTREPIAQATIAVQGSNITVVTNDEGYFTLKVDSRPEQLFVSHLGYTSQPVRVPSDISKPLNIRLRPASVQLKELVVWTGDARELVDIAISKIVQNYSKAPELFKCFYRETAMKRRHFIYVAEGVVDMYKTSYNRGTYKDRVAIRKGRRLVSPKTSDTLSVKVIGGPVQPIQLDIVKNTDFLLNEQDLNCYSFQMDGWETIDNRMQFVVSISPKVEMPYALHYGKFYIDRETLAFTRVELSLDMSDRDKATRYMLFKKPRGVRFRPKEMSCLINYRYDNGVSRIHYIRNTFRFNCDWKRRLFATSFSACCEMVVTDKADVAEPIKGRQSFDSTDAFYDQVDFFRDPDFWEGYNIIEPTETLDKAIDKLTKKYK